MEAIADMVEHDAVKHVAGKRISVIGMARSGMTVAELLSRNGAKVFVSDSGSSSKLAQSMQHLGSLGIASEADNHTDKVFDADMIVLSPGVPSDAPVVKQATARGIQVVSEVETASWFCPSPVIAITGTNGKTTTTSLVGRMLHDGKIKHAVGGNIGTAFSSLIDELDEKSVAVLEISSFQLDHIETFHPKVSVLLNITPDHLDRYDHSFDKYIASKCRIFENQMMNDVLIYNYDDQIVRQRVESMAKGHVRLLPFSAKEQLSHGAFTDNGALITLLDGKRSEIIAIEQISIPGLHNLYNSMAATLAAQVVGVAPMSLRNTLRNFKGVEHRLEFVREVDGVRYVNDSKATNVDSVWYALQSFKQPLVVLLGGRDKGNDYSTLDELVRNHVKAIVAIGESADKVMTHFSSIVPTVKTDSMKAAIETARSLAKAGDVVLLSPACASFDWFDNYEHRGRAFKELVNQL